MSKSKKDDPKTDPGRTEVRESKDSPPKRLTESVKPTKKRSGSDRKK